MPGTPQRSDTPFQRLWHGFLSARALVALALLLLQGAGLALHQNPEPELLALCALYLVVTVLTRLLAALDAKARRREPGDRQHAAFEHEVQPLGVRDEEQAQRPRHFVSLWKPKVRMRL